MIFVKINNKIFFVKKNISILEACKFVGILIPRFCYQESLSIAGNCRMCLVEIEPNVNLKPVSACTLPIVEDSHILTETPFVKKARENVLETLLLNHPLDCPICDQGGECDLQDQTLLYGIKSSRYSIVKRSVEDKNMGSFIKTIMTRCIHCTRCVRFSEEIAGMKFLGTLNRGSHTEIGTYVTKIFESNISGNVIDLCPVGALTSKVYAFKARPWELKTTETIDLTDSSGTPIFVSVKESEIVRVMPKKDTYLTSLFISDKARFSFDAVNNLRLLQPYVKKSNWESLNWQTLLLTLNEYKSKKYNLFLISEDLDFQTLHNLYNLQTSNTLNFSINTTAIKKSTNFYTNSAFSKITKLNTKYQICCLISSNLQVENIFLNIKIRTKYAKTLFKVYSSGFNSSASFPTSLLTINTSLLLRIFEAKNTFSLFLLKHLNPIFIFGTSSINRFSIVSITSLVKKVLPTSLFFYINKSSNTEAVNFFNIKTINNNLLKKANLVFATSLANSLFLNSLFLKLKNSLVFWLNSHIPFFSKNISYLIPTFTFFEFDGIFLNFDGQANKAYKTLINSNNQAVSINFFTNYFLTLSGAKNIAQKTTAAYLYFNEMANSTLTSNVNFLIHFSKEDSASFFFHKYPLKPIIEDFYQTDSFTKNSWHMFKRSKEIRSISNNFFN